MLYISTREQFFVSLDLPFSVVVGEHLEVRIFIHNTWTGTAHRDVIIALKNSDNAFEFPGNSLANSKLLIPCAPKSVTKRAVTIKLVKTGVVNVQLVAQSDSDEALVEKSLLVVPTPEVRRYITSSFFKALPSPVSSSHLKSFLIDLDNPAVIPNIPGNAAKTKSELRTLESWKLFVSSDIMTLVSNNVDRLVTLPSNSLETKILRFAANIAILTYIPKTMHSHPEYRARAVISLEQDYQHLLYAHCPGGSFTDSNTKSNCPGSIELTARIVRYLILAKNLTFIDDEIVKQGLEFLKNQLHAHWAKNLINLQKDFNSHIAGTALTVLVFLEQQRSSSNLAGYEYLSTMERARELFQQYYENTLEGNDEIHDTRTQALMTYAEHVWNEVNPSETTKIYIYWHKLWPKQLASRTTLFGTPEVKVETLSYIILTTLVRGEHSDAIFYLNRILPDLNPYGGFLSTKDTEVAVMALAKLAERDRKFPTQLQINISALHQGVDYTIVKTAVEMNQSLALKEFTLPRETKKVKLEASGNGLFFAQLIHTHSVPRKARNGPFIINVRKIKDEGRRHSVIICIGLRTTGRSGATVLDVNLPSGYKFEQVPTTEPLRKMYNYRSHEFVDMNSKLRIVWGTVLQFPRSCGDVKVFRVFRVEELKPSFVQAYEFFDTTNVSQIIYDI